MIHAGNLNSIIQAIFAAFNMGTVGGPELPQTANDDEEPDEDEKN